MAKCTPCNGCNRNITSRDEGRFCMKVKEGMLKPDLGGLKTRKAKVQDNAVDLPPGNTEAHTVRTELMDFVSPLQGLWSLRTCCPRAFLG